MKVFALSHVGKFLLFSHIAHMLHDENFQHVCVCMEQLKIIIHSSYLCTNGMGKRPATMVRELPLVSSVEQRQVVHGAQHAAMSPFPYMIIMTCHEMRLWEGHGNMGTKRE